MSYETERDAIAARLVAQWGSTTAISWDGLNGKPYERQPGVAFIRPRIDGGEAAWQGVGYSVNRQRSDSTLVMEVFYPAGKSQETPLQYCDQLIAAFDRFTSGGVRFMRRAWSRKAEDDGAWAKYMVFAPFYREEVA